MSKPVVVALAVVALAAMACTPKGTPVHAPVIGTADINTIQVIVSAVNKDGFAAPLTTGREGLKIRLVRTGAVKADITGYVRNPYAERLSWPASGSQNVSVTVDYAGPASSDVTQLRCSFGDDLGTEVAGTYQGADVVHGKGHVACQYPPT